MIVTRGGKTLYRDAFGLADGQGNWVVGLVGVQSEKFRKVTLTAADLERLAVLDSEHSFDGDGRLLRLGLQAYALGIAYEFDPYFGLSISTDRKVVPPLAALRRTICPLPPFRLGCHGAQWRLCRVASHYW